MLFENKYRINKPIIIIFERLIQFYKIIKKIKSYKNIFFRLIIKEY